MMSTVATATPSLVTSDHLNFILAGNATFTVVSLRTGVRYTYKVVKRKPKPDSPFKSMYPGWWVRLLSGPDNTSDYTPLGCVREIKKGHYILAGGRDVDQHPSQPPVIAIQWLLRRLSIQQTIDGVEIYHAGRCGRCGRLLTVPESVSSGLGPECRGKS